MGNAHEHGILSQDIYSFPVRFHSVPFCRLSSLMWQWWVTHMNMEYFPKTFILSPFGWVLFCWLSSLMWQLWVMHINMEIPKTCILSPFCSVPFRRLSSLMWQSKKNQALDVPLYQVQTEASFSVKIPTHPIRSIQYNINNHSMLKWFFIFE
jgi:hypothetical protein